MRRRAACASEISGGPPALRRQRSDTADEYIKAADKFPLEAGRFGFLPLAIQRFLRTDNSLCVVSDTNATLRSNHPCLLRRGVQASKHQSFVGCIAELWLDGRRKAAHTPTIAEMRGLLRDALTLDEFTSLQNGSLVQEFWPGTGGALAAHSSSRLAASVDPADPAQLQAGERAVAAYDNFRAFLDSADAVMDHTYLWDLVCRPNPKLFERGLNLLILEWRSEDVTDNIHVLCPTNHYSSELFNPMRRTALILKRDRYFEPIFRFEDQGTRLRADSQFRHVRSG